MNLGNKKDYEGDRELTALLEEPKSYFPAFQ